LGMAKQLGLEQVIGQRRAIDIAKAPFAPRAELMQGAGNELLARTAFPRERSVAGNLWWTSRRIGLGRVGSEGQAEGQPTSRSRATRKDEQSAGRPFTAKPCLRSQFRARSP